MNLKGNEMSIRERMEKGKRRRKWCAYHLRNKRKSFGKGSTVKEMMKMPRTDHT